MKLQIAVRILGHKVPDLDVTNIVKWRSSVWAVHEGRIDAYPLNGDCDLEYWGYSDFGLNTRAVSAKGADFTLYILNVPLEDNFFFRRISTNVGCVSFFEVADVLRSHNIPIENLLLRMLYSSAMIYFRKGALPPINELSTLAHHETKGCIFDMAGLKTDIVFSCNRPILCEACRAASSEDRVSKEAIETFVKEIDQINKRLYFRIAEWVKRQPLLALLLSAGMAFIVGVLGSLASSLIYENLRDREPGSSMTSESSLQKTLSPSQTGASPR